MSKVGEQQDTDANASNDSEENADGELESDVYEVEKILGIKKIDGETRYLVRWKNFGPDDDTWEPEGNLLSCMGLVHEYKAKQAKEREKKKKKLVDNATKKHRSLSSGESFLEQLRQEEVNHASGKKKDLKMPSKPPKPKVQQENVLSASKPTKSKVPENGSSTSKPSKPKDPANVSSSTNKPKPKLPENVSSSTTKPSKTKLPENDSSTKKLKKSSANGKPPERTESIRSNTSDVSSTGLQPMEVSNHNIDNDVASPSNHRSMLANSQVLTPNGTTNNNLASHSISTDQEVIVKRNDTPRVSLLRAVYTMNAELVTSLLEDYEILDAVDQINSAGCTLIMHCAKRQDNDERDNCTIIELLASHGADVNFRNVEYETALMLICKKGSQCCLETLLKFTPKLDLENRTNETALFMAVRRKNPDIVVALLNAGAEFAKRNANGECVLDIIENQLKQEPKSDKVVAMKNIITSLASKLENAFHEFALAVSKGKVDLSMPLFDLRYFTFADHRKVSLSFDGSPTLKEGKHAVVFFICTAHIPSDDIPTMHCTGQTDIIDKVIRNGVVQKDISFEQKAMFAEQGLFYDKGNNMEIQLNRALKPKEMVLVRGYACRLNSNQKED